MTFSIHGTNRPRSHAVADPAQREEEIWLTVTDRFSLRRFLAFAETGRITYPDPLLALLRHKLAVARNACNPAPATLATFGRQVRYRLDNRSLLSEGLLAVGLVKLAGEVPIHSMLGATLLGMSVGQSTSFTGEKGITRKVTLVEVAGSQGRRPTGA